jgi:hypothetical protein
MASTIDPHYLFAHVALRQVALAQPVQVLSILATEKRTEFFDELLEKQAGHYPDVGPATFTGADIACTCVRIGGHPAAILTMPPPQHPTEAYFVAIVSRLPTRRFFTRRNLENGADLVDYYTLERPVDLDEDGPEPCGVFCGWTKDAHLNFGTGPQPEFEAFKRFLTVRLAFAPRRLRKIAVGVLVFVAIALFTWKMTRNAQQALPQTRAVLTQLAGRYRQALAQGATPATSTTDFLQRVPAWKIDWQQCALRDGDLYDAWGLPIHVRVSPAEIELRSAGPDRTLSTADDLTERVAQKPAG